MERSMHSWESLADKPEKSRVTIRQPSTFDYLFRRDAALLENSKYQVQKVLIALSKASQKLRYLESKVNLDLDFCKQDLSKMLDVILSAFKQHASKAEHRDLSEKSIQEFFRSETGQSLMRSYKRIKQEVHIRYRRVRLIQTKLGEVLHVGDNIESVLEQTEVHTVVYEAFKEASQVLAPLASAHSVQVRHDDVALDFMDSMNDHLEKSRQFIDTIFANGEDTTSGPLGVDEVATAEISAALMEAVRSMNQEKDVEFHRAFPTVPYATTKQPTFPSPAPRSQNGGNEIPIAVVHAQEKVDRVDST